MVVTIILALVINVDAVSLNYELTPEEPNPDDVFTLDVLIDSQGSFLKDLRAIFLTENENLKILNNGKESPILIKDIGDVYGSSRTSLKLIAHESGVYTLRIKISYDYGTESFEDSISIWVVEKPSINVTWHFIPEISSGEVSNISFMLKNEGGKARNFVAEISTPDGLTHSGKFQKEMMNEGESFEVSFRLSANNDLKPGVYPILLSLRFEDVLGNEYSETHNFPVKVEEKSLISISNISTSPESIYPGDTFTLFIELQNYGKKKVENVRAEIKFPSGFEGETEKFAGSIYAGEKKVLAYRIKADKSISGGLYPFKLVLHSESFDEAREFDFGVFVREFGEIGLEISGVYFSEKPLTDSEFTLSLQLENVGQQDAKAVSVLLELPEGFEGRNQYFVGTIDGGDSATATFDLKAPSQSGDYAIKARISYLDGRNERHEVERYFTMHVYSSESKMSVYAGVVFLLLIIAGLVLWRGKRK